MAHIVRSRLGWLVAVAVGVVALNAVRVAVQGPDDFFAGQVLQRLDVIVNSSDWQALHHGRDAGPCYPATLKWNSAVARNVGLCSADAGGRKPQLEVNASWYVSDGAFLGLSRFTLDNLDQDPSAVRRTVALRFYQWMDLPAPRSAHVALYVNDEYAGLYALIEPVSSAVPRYSASKGQAMGRLYRYAAAVPYRFDYLGTDLTSYRDLFPSDPEPSDVRSDDYAAIEEMIRVAAGGTVPAGANGLSSILDARQFMKTAAVQTFLAIPAGIAGPGGMSDFSLHVRPGKYPIQFVANGESLGLTDPRYPIDQGLAGSALMRLAAHVPSLYQLYADSLLASATIAENPNRLAGFGPSLQTEIEHQQRLAAGAVRADGFRLWTDRDFQDASAVVVQFAEQRAQFVRCQVEALLHQAGPCSARPAAAGPATAAGPSISPASIHTESTSAATPSSNLARGRPYTLDPRPNYPLTSDAADDVQLTDGVYTAGTLWTHATSVGWTNALPVSVVIDLGASQPISGVSYSTAAGTAGVSWPRSIFVLVSDDGRTFFPAGDLAAAGTAQPPAGGYATFRFARNDFKTHGRFVALMVDTVGPYTFCDEIEVLGGDPAWLRTPLAGESTADLHTFFVNARTRASIERRLAADLATVRTGLRSSSVSAAVRFRLNVALLAAERNAAAMTVPPHDSFRTVLPLNTAHRQIFAVRGETAEARGLSPLTAWAANPWDFVRPTDDPPPAGHDAGTVSIAAMAGETRSGAINFSNATGRPMQVAIDIRDLSSAPGAGDVELYETIWTDTQELTPVADALVPLGSARSFDLPAGMTKQLWIRFTPAARPPGIYRARVEAAGAGGVRASVPIELRVLPGLLPARPRLHLGGWDYSDGDRMYGLTPNNRDALLRQLRELHVDAPWARSTTLGAGTFDAAGRLQTAPDTSAFDRWVASWPDAGRYMVFVNVKDALGDVPIGDARFAVAAAQWIRFWAAHAEALGIQPSQLMLLLVDEPHLPGQDDRIVAWANAVKAGEPRVRIWEDPTYADPASLPPRLLDAIDLIALKRSLMLQHGAPFVDFYRQRRARGQSLDVYGSSGPVRLLDPYTYHRLQAWVCAEIGAGASFFWSFIDDAGGSSWNEYGALQTLYSPFFLSDNEVTISKHSEAIREGTEDFEYLAMLRDRVSELNRRDPNTPGLAAAAALVDSAAATVLGAAGATDLEWSSDKDRSAADRVRLAIADALEALRR